jgi:hypothetical protein
MLRYTLLVPLIDCGQVHVQTRQRAIQEHTVPPPGSAGAAAAAFEWASCQSNSARPHFPATIRCSTAICTPAPAHMTAPKLACRAQCLSHCLYYNVDAAAHNCEDLRSAPRHQHRVSPSGSRLDLGSRWCGGAIVSGAIEDGLTKRTWNMQLQVDSAIRPNASVHRFFPRFLLCGLHEKRPCADNGCSTNCRFL